MSDNWDDYAEGWDTNPAVISYSNRAYQALTALTELTACKVLDFGCGTGLLTEKIAQHASAVVALDPSAKMLTVLDNKQLANVATVAAELSPALINNDTRLQAGFDVIVASSSLAFVPDYIATLKLLKPLLAADGLLVQWDWLQAPDSEGMGFSVNEIESAYKLAGYNHVTTTTAFSLEGPDGNMPVVMAYAQA